MELYSCPQTRLKDTEVSKEINKSQKSQDGQAVNIVNMKSQKCVYIQLCICRYAGKPYVPREMLSKTLMGNLAHNIELTSGKPAH